MAARARLAEARTSFGSAACSKVVTGRLTPSLPAVA
jgi:hypothetical protein